MKRLVPIIFILIAAVLIVSDAARKKQTNLLLAWNLPIPLLKQRMSMAIQQELVLI